MRAEMIGVADVHMGMDVYSSDGENLGRINEVYNSVAEGQATQGEEHLWMAVSEGDVLEFWKGTLYVPVDEVEDVKPGRHVTLKTSAQDARSKYAEKPHWLK